MDPWPMTNSSEMGLDRAAHVVQEEPHRFVVEHAVPVQHEVADRLLRAGKRRGQFPVARNAAPDRVRLHRLLALEPDGFANPPRSEGFDYEDRDGTSVEGRRAV